MLEAIKQEIEAEIRFRKLVLEIARTRVPIVSSVINIALRLAASKLLVINALRAASQLSEKKKVQQ